MNTRTFLTALALPLLSLVGSAQTPPLKPACGGITTVPPAEYSVQPIRCTCGGGEVALGFDQSLPGGQIGGSYTSGGDLICTGAMYMPAYDTFTPSGDALVMQTGTASSVLHSPICDTDDCGQFLGFLWSTGSAKCDLLIYPHFGAVGVYSIVGQCSKGEDVGAVASAYPLILSPKASN